MSAKPETTAKETSAKETLGSLMRELVTTVEEAKKE